MNQEQILAQFGPREAMEYDVVVVGAGPAGLATAIRLKQLAAEYEKEVSVVVLEKGSEPGAHILSGAIIDTRALTELIPDWKKLGAPLTQPVTEDIFLFLSETGATRTPGFLLPDCFDNHGNYVGSLAMLTRWLAQQAEGLGVEIFAGFPAAEVLYNDEGAADGKLPAVKGVATANMGIGKDGKPTDGFQLGMELHAKYTIFAEGSRGHLGKQLISKFKLDAGKDPQSYSIGIKEIWEVDPSRHKPGLALHSAGWPLDSDTYGGSWMYHMADNLISIGFVVGLDYKNPYMSPFDEFQRFKTHPNIRWYFEGGDAESDVKGKPQAFKAAKRLAYGARSLTVGGILSLPKTIFPGGALVGCNAGFLNASRIKGSHSAIKTGMLAAQAAFQAVIAGRQHDELTAYPAAFEESWLRAELDKARNFKQWFKKGRTVATLMTGVEQFVLKGRMPWTIHRDKPDHVYLKPAAECKPIIYPKPDGKLTFDRLSSVYISNTNHAEDQPAHLTLRDPSIPVNVNLAKYAGPEGRYCPAGVYEYVKNEDNTDRLQINAQNCVHCKTCDIKDPMQNIVWVAPEGGGGPNYANM